MLPALVGYRYLHRGRLRGAWVEGVMSTSEILAGQVT